MGMVNGAMREIVGVKDGADEDEQENYDCVDWDCITSLLSTASARCHMLAGSS